LIIVLYLIDTPDFDTRAKLAIFTEGSVSALCCCSISPYLHGRRPQRAASEHDALPVINETLDRSYQHL